MDPAWLFGAGGQAFALNISRETLCPSGPTAWWTEGLHGLLANLGLARECIFSHHGSDDFATASAQVWAECRGFAPRFLRTAGSALPESRAGLELAAGFYAVVAGELARVAELFPFEGDRVARVADAERIREAGDHLEALAGLVESL